MKGFIKYTLASLLALILFSVVATIIMLVSFAGMMATDGMKTSVKENTILRIDLGGVLEEQTQDDPMTMIMGGGQESIAGLQTMTEAIKRAKDNDKVKGIYLENAVLSGTPATVQELRQALLEFKKSGKFIVAYSDNYSQSGYYISSVADKIMVNPEGMVDWHGLASQPMFFKDAMAKIGVKMQVFKVGTFKSAVEPFINTEMSEANREQVTSFLGSIWQNMLNEVSASRKISVEKLNTLADEYVAMHPASYMVETHLVDTLSYMDGVKAYLKRQMNLDDDKSLTFISAKEMAVAEVPEYKEEEDKIAIYYAVGDIVQTDNAVGMSGNAPKIVGEKVIDDLRGLREDDDVKAVVLRVNSGGGSAYASEQIWREVELLKEKKPVVVSMGGMAASGGYYISSGANKIFAEPTTLTGSIGIFGMIPDMSELLTQKVGVKFDVVKTNALSDMGTMGRPMNAEESSLMQAMVERGYETFTGRVAYGRKMDIAKVKEIAEGRVWTGEQAKELGLVDQLGNLQAAIKSAAKLSKVEKYNTVNYPEPEPWFKSLLNDKKSGYLDAEMRNMMGEYYTTFSLLQTIKTQDRIQARLPFEPNIK